MKTQQVSLDERGGQFKGWLDDPYDSNETGPMTRNISERPNMIHVFQITP
jgi:hypothetical protein